MYIKMISRLAMVALIAISSFSCAVPLHTVVWGPQDASGVPREYNPERDILLVAALPNPDYPNQVDEKSTRKLDKEMKKQFPYRYKIVSLISVLDTTEKISDSSAYRFALLCERRVIKEPGTFQAAPYHGIGFMPSYKSTVTDFAFYDRLNKQRFPHSGNGTSVMRIAVSNLTAWVKKAKQQSSTEVATVTKSVR
jgi:hypothetical protein